MWATLVGLDPLGIERRATEPTRGLKVLDGNGASAKVSRVDSCLDIVPLVRVGHVKDILDS